MGSMTSISHTASNLSESTISVSQATTTVPKPATRLSKNTAKAPLPTPATPVTVPHKRQASEMDDDASPSDNKDGDRFDDDDPYVSHVHRLTKIGSSFLNAVKAEEHRWETVFASPSTTAKEQKALNRLKWA